MKFTSRALLCCCMFAAGCWFPMVDVAYQGNGDDGILAFMRDNYTSYEAGIAKHLKGHLEAGLQPGQVINQAYLVRRGASCTNGVPIVCSFKGVAREHFRGVPKENAARACRFTSIEARVVLLQPVSVEVVKQESYPDIDKAAR